MLEVKAGEKRDGLTHVLVVVVSTVAGLCKAQTANRSRSRRVGGRGSRSRCRVSVDEAAALAIRTCSSHPEGSADLRFVLEGDPSLVRSYTCKVYPSYLGVPRDPTEFVIAMGELAFQTVAAGPLLFPVAAELTLEPNRGWC